MTQKGDRVTVTYPKAPGPQLIETAGKVVAVHEGDLVTVEIEVPIVQKGERKTKKTELRKVRPFAPGVRAPHYSDPNRPSAGLDLTEESVSKLKVEDLKTLYQKLTGEEPEAGWKKADLVEFVLEAAEE